MTDSKYSFLKKENELVAKEYIEEKIIIPFTRILGNDRSLSYRKRTSEFRPPLHWGQRKLLLEEIEFLTNFGNLAKIVLYIGAADGRHISYLANLFNEHQFILYDPGKYDKSLFGIKNVEIHVETFTDQLAIKYSETKLLFISDIRTIPEGYTKTICLDELDDTIDDLADNIKVDMEMQKNWYYILKPQATMLKFRLPYIPGKTEYLDGDLYYQLWAPSTSTETRLVIKGSDAKTKIYDNIEYESILYRFNRCTRIQKFPEIFEKYQIPNMIDQSYDLAGEILILDNYLTSKNKNENIYEMILEINKYLGKNFKDKYDEKIIEYKRRLKKIQNKNIKKRIV